MGQIQVDARTSRSHIQQQLATFGMFSKVEATLDQSAASTVYLREVGLMEQFRRLFSPGAAREAAQNSRDAMLKLAETHPEVGKLLGMSLLEPRAWSTSELRQGLKVGASKLERGADKQLDAERPELLAVANARKDAIRADTRIDWSMTSVTPDATLNYRRVRVDIGKDGKGVVSVLSFTDPTPEQREMAYRGAIGNAKGHIVLEPLPGSKDEDIDCLLRVIEEFRGKPGWSERHRITIAAGGEPGLADRIWDRKAVLDAAARVPAKPGNGRVAMPTALRVLTGSQATHAKRAGLDVTGKCTPSANAFVSFWQGDPAQLAAGALFLHPEAVRQQALTLQRAGHGQLQRVHAEAYENDGLIGHEAKDLMARSARQWGMAAIELPACELPAQRLFAFSRTGVHQTTPATPRDFFLTHLNSLSGRVVIALTGDPEIDSAACEAARGMTQPPPPESREVIFASSNSQVLAAAQAWMQ